MNYEAIWLCFRQNLEKSILQKHYRKYWKIQKILYYRNIIIENQKEEGALRNLTISQAAEGGLDTTLIAESYQSQRGSERKKLNTFMPKEYNIVFYRETHRCRVYATKRPERIRTNAQCSQNGIWSDDIRDRERDSFENPSWEGN